jgi:hypothetical protein
VDFEEVYYVLFFCFAVHSSDSQILLSESFCHIRVS